MPVRQQILSRSIARLEPRVVEIPWRMRSRVLLDHLVWLHVQIVIAERCEFYKRGASQVHGGAASGVMGSEERLPS